VNKSLIEKQVEAKAKLRSLLDEIKQQFDEWKTPVSSIREQFISLCGKIYYRENPHKFKSIEEAGIAFLDETGGAFEPESSSLYLKATSQEKEAFSANIIRLFQLLPPFLKSLRELKSFFELYESPFSEDLIKKGSVLDEFLTLIETLYGSLDSINSENLMRYYAPASRLFKYLDNIRMGSIRDQDLLSSFFAFLREAKSWTEKRVIIGDPEIMDVLEGAPFVPTEPGKTDKSHRDKFLKDQPNTPSYLNQIRQLQEEGEKLPKILHLFIDHFKDWEKIASFQKKWGSHHKKIMQKGQNVVFHGWHPGIDPDEDSDISKEESLQQVEDLVENPIHKEMFSFVEDLRVKGVKLLELKGGSQLSPQAQAWIEWLRFDSLFPTQKGLERLRKVLAELKDPKVILEVLENLPLMEFDLLKTNELAGEFQSFVDIVIVSWGTEALIKNRAFSSPKELGRFLSLLMRPLTQGSHYPDLPLRINRDQLLFLAISEISSLKDLKAFLKGFDKRAFLTSTFSQAWDDLKKKGVLGKDFETDLAFVSLFALNKDPYLEEVIKTHGSKKRILQKVLPIMVHKEKYKKRVKGWINSKKKISSKEKLNEYLRYGFFPTQADLKEYFNIEVGNWQQYQVVAEILREKGEIDKRFQALQREWGLTAYKDWQSQNKEAPFGDELEILTQFVPPHKKRNPHLLNLIKEKAATSHNIQAAIPHFVLPSIRRKLHQQKDKILEESLKTQKEIRKNLENYHYYEQTKILPQDLKKPEEAYKDEDFLEEKIEAGKAGWEKAKKESRIGQSLKDDLDLVESLFPEPSATRDKLLDELILDQVAMLGLSDFKRAVSLYSPLIQPERGALFLEELLNRHFQDTGFVLTEYEKKLIEALTQKKMSQSEELFEFSLTEKYRIVYLLRKKWEGKKEVGPTHRKSPALANLGFNEELNKVLLLLFPHPSHIRDELLRELENFKARHWEEVKLSQGLLFENSKVSRQESTLARNAALQTLKDTVKIISPENKAELIFWLLIPKYEKPFVIHGIENGSRYSLDFLKERRNEVSRADRGSFSSGAFGRRRRNFYFWLQRS